MAGKKLLIALISSSMIAAPTVAMAQTSAAAGQAVAVQPAIETVQGSASHCEPGDDDCRRHGGFIIPLIALALVILGLLIMLKDDEDELPVTPA